MDKRQQIFDSALKLFVECGFHGTPTSRIAKEAGISNGTLFHYFGAKEDLIKELYIAVKEELNKHLRSKMKAGDTVEKKFKTVYVHSVYWGLQNPEKFHYIQQIHFSPHIAQIPNKLLHEQMLDHIELIEQAKERHIIKNLPTDMVFTLAMSNITGIYNYTLPLPANRRKSAIEIGYTMFWDMITE